MPDQRAVLPACEFTRNGITPSGCGRTAEPVEMYDGGIVNLCGYHRPWAVAVSRVDASREQDTDQNVPLGPGTSSGES